MRKHVRHVAVGGAVGPLALAIAAAIANEAQTLLGLNLHGEALAIFTAPFVLGAAAVLHGQLRLEAQKIMAELGNGELDLGALLGAVGNLFPTETPTTAPPAPPAPAAAAIAPPPPPPPAP